MALIDNKRLYDISTRLQVLIEGVKVQQAREFNFILYELREELKKLLTRVRYRTLDGLTKGELNRLILSLRESQSKVYSKYAQQLIEQLKAFMRADLEINRRAYATTFAESKTGEEQKALTDAQAIALILKEDESSSLVPLFGIAAITGNDERFWSIATNSPIPANGLYLLPFIATFTNSAQAGVENIIRKAWANGWTLEETIAAITGEDARQGTSSQLQRVGVQASAVINTAVQHIGALAGAAVISALYGRYIWLSVMDSRTSDICISRNRQIYRFGNGPLPPAHINCRSHISPIVGTDDLAAETFYTWAARQPNSVQDDILGDDTGEALRNGTLKAKDLPNYKATRPLTLDEFRSRINEVLSR